MFLYFLILFSLIILLRSSKFYYLTFILKIKYTDNSRISTAVITIFIILKAKRLQQHLKLNRHFRILDVLLI
jgi:hypothetical protein